MWRRHSYLNIDLSAQEGIYAYITLKDDPMEKVFKSHEFSVTEEKSLINMVRKEIGAFAAPELIHFAHGLPKVRLFFLLATLLWSDS